MRACAHRGAFAHRGACHLALLLVLAAGCERGHGPIAEDVMAPMGQPVPFASAEQMETFERGREVSNHRFSRAEGLGPAFNVTFCASCHERPTDGGSAGLYRNFSIAAHRTEDGVYRAAQSGGMSSGVVRIYGDGEHVSPHPGVDPINDIVGGRNPIPFFGVGLLAAIPEEEILSRADPDDRNNDGISGRANYDRGFVGRFGMKAQTVSIEGFIRGPLFNHLGITTDPLSDEMKALLPVDSSAGAALRQERGLFGLDFRLISDAFAQVAAPEEPLTDDDGIPDPEMPEQDLFDLVSMAMLMAAPEVEELSEQGLRGQRLFDRARCDDCHTPRLEGPRGPLPVYSDLLLHDMGEELADGIIAGEATASEFRTQPLWGLAAVGPYLHDGRATTIEEAILWHGGEATASRDRFAAYDEEERADVIEFLLSLGGRAQYSDGLIPPDEPVPSVLEWGGPRRVLDEAGQARFEAGRALFDREFGFVDGAGGPRLNGDSCRACHFEPVVGGSGPRGVNVVRHGFLNGEGEFVPPAVGTILHRVSALSGEFPRPQSEVDVFELRQTPHLFGLGEIETISDETILAGADPDDRDGDGISGKPSWTDGGRLGRFGWKGQVPTIDEFIRDAVTAELGMTLPWVEGLTFGRIYDNDDVPDPEMQLEEAELLADYLRELAPPPRTAGDAALIAAGEQVFEDIRCSACHTPSLPGANGPVPLYSDLLLHQMVPTGTPGIEEASAEMEEFRTPPLWGLAETAPYLHNGAADTLEQAIAGHGGEAESIAAAFAALPQQDQQALLAFLASL